MVRTSLCGLAPYVPTDSKTKTTLSYEFLTLSCNKNPKRFENKNICATSRILCAPSIEKGENIPLSFFFWPTYQPACLQAELATRWLLGLRSNFPLRYSLTVLYVRLGPCLADKLNLSLKYVAQKIENVKLVFRVGFYWVKVLGEQGR
jgi:hypothetical protein